VWRAVYRSGVLIPLVFILLTARFAPIAYPGEFDVDEGVNLAKTLLVSRGYALYRDIWSDQAPLATVVLSQWIKWFGASVVASRILILLFSALLLWAFYQTIRLTLSESAALVAVALLLISQWYVRLSISVMIGLPALALAALSIHLLLLAQERNGPWLTIVSGVVLAASLQAKLFTAILVPEILVYILFLMPVGGQIAPRPTPQTARDSAPRQRFERCATWLAAFLAAFVTMAFVFRSFDLSQLVAPHLGAGTRSVFPGGNLGYVGTALLRHVAYVPLAIIGLVWALRNGKPVVFLPLGWLVMALAFLLYERPLWYHHVLVLTIPLVWLSAFGVEAGLRALRRSNLAAKNERRHPARTLARTPKMWIVVFLGAVIAVLTVFDPVTRGHHISEEIPGPVPDYGEKVVELLCPGGRSKEAWVFTDRPIYAFQAGLAVPPPIAVLTGKRLFSGTITENDLLAVLRTYRPEYVLLERFLPNYGQDFLTAVAGMYDLAREYSVGLGRLPGQLLVPNSLSAENGGGADRRLAKALFSDWLSLEWNPAFSPDESEAGNCLQVRDLQWTRPETFGVPDLALSIRLTDRAGEVWVQHDEQLGYDKNTLRDRARLPYFVNLLVPEGTPPGVYDTQLVVYDPQSGQPLPVTPANDTGSSSNQTVGGDRLVLGQVQIARQAQGSALRRPLADFGPVRLVEADTPATQVSPGDSAPLSLLWQAGPDFREESLVVVAQLLDQGGNVVAGLEEEPLQGRYPTTGWQPRELVRDHHVLAVPPGTPAGQYELIVGLYTLPDRNRLKMGAGFLGLTPREYFPVRPIQVASPPS
jgi:Dolichyl-phosphate-mannose-protein mannosyltransferase